MISLVLVEDQNTILQLLKIYLEQELDIRVVGVSVNGEEAVNQIEQLQPDVVLMDIEMPKLDGLSATRIIVQRCPQTKVVILSTHSGENYVNAARQAGAKAYLLKNTSPQELVETIRIVNQDYFPSEENLDKSEPLKHSEVKSGHQQQSVSMEESKTAPIQELSSIKPKALLKYVGVSLVLHLLVWTLPLAYLKFSTPLYTSQWRVKILTTDPRTEKIVTEEEQIANLPGGWSPLLQPDRIQNYIELATSAQVVAKAADLRGITVEDFGKPKITVQEDNSLLDFSVEGQTPEEAQQKALLFYQVMRKQMEVLPIIQGNLLTELAANRTEWSQLVTPNQELETQITQREEGLQFSSPQQLKLESLQRDLADLKVGEIIWPAMGNQEEGSQYFLELMEPTIQLVTEPTRPENPTSPSLSSAVRGGIAGSLLVTIGLVLGWYYPADWLPRAILVKHKLKNRETTASGVWAELETSEIIRSDKTREKATQKGDTRTELSEPRQLLAHAPDSIRASLNPKALLQTAVAEARQLIAADRVVVYSLDEQSPGQIVAESVEAGYPQILGASLDDPCFRANYREKYQQGRVKAIDDIYQANLTRCHLTQLQSLRIKANLVAPILTQGRLIGLLIAHHCATTHAWQPAEIKVFVQIAKQLGLVLDNTQLLGSLYKLVDVEKP